MTIGNNIQLPIDRHQEALNLLPWYATGAIEPADRVKVEAHLSDCASCREELATEHQLRAAIADLPLDACLGFAEFRRRIEITPPRAAQRRPHPRRSAIGAPDRSGWTGWGIAAQVATVLLFVGVAFPAMQKPAEYRTLGSAPRHPEGNMVVMFGPNMSEQTMRQLMESIGASLVEGPTSTGVYVLSVALNRRAAALAELRARSDVTLAQPIDRDGHS
jgi:hypothetical protein